MNTIKIFNCLIKFALILFFCFCVSTCDKGVNSDRVILNCLDLQDGIINTDHEIVVSEINKLTADLRPAKTSNDELGHKQNLSLLIKRINSSCDDVNAELGCYACIETYPAQSEIKVITDSSGTDIVRILDILTPEDDVLNCIRIHE